MLQNNQPVSPAGGPADGEQQEFKLTKKNIIAGVVILAVIIFISTFGWWRGSPFAKLFDKKQNQPAYQLNNSEDKQWYDILQKNLTQLEDYPNSFEARVGIARARAYFKDYDGAIKMYQQANEISPKNTTAWGNLGHLFMGLERYDEAGKCFLQAIQNKPAEVGFYVDLSQMYYEKMGKKKEAEEILLQGLSYDLNKNSGTLMSALASYYEKESRFSEALKWYEKMLMVNPDNQSVKDKIEELKGRL